MRERAALLLEGQPGEVPSSLLARELLGIGGGSEELCHSLLAPILGGDRRIEDLGARGWRLRDTPAAEAVAPSPPVEWTWAVWAAEPGLCAAAVVRVERGAIAGERLETASASTPDSARSTGEEHGGAEHLFLEPLDAPPGNTSEEQLFARHDVPSRGGGLPTLSTSALGRLAAVADGAVAFVTAERSALTAEWERRLREVEGADPPPRLVLRRLAGASLPAPAPRTLEDTASRLDVPLVAADHPLGRARITAECLLRLLELDALSSARTLSDLHALPHSREAAGPDFGGRAFDGAFLDDLPDSPGTYRFFDRDLNLLYVGKARDLRARVRSYFAHRSRPDPRTAPWISDVHSIEIERSGSELEALLREAELIARARPSRNTQRRVHERPRAASADLVLLLPAGRGRDVVAHLVREGALAGRVRIGPRGGGRRHLEERISALYFDAPGRLPEGTARRPAGADASRAPRRSPGEREEAPRPRVGAGRPARDLREPPPTPYRTASAARGRSLIASWLRRHRGPVPAFDPTDAAGPREAAALALQYAESVRRGEGDVIYR